MIAPHVMTFHTHSAEETRSLGERLGRLLRGGDIVALQGALGAGKTTLAQGIAAGLGVVRAVTSPTFTLVNEYHGRDDLVVVHVDLYRLAEGDAALLEAESLGLDEYAGARDAVVLIEWAERLAAWIPPDCLYVALMADAPLDEPREGGAESRVVRVSGAGARALEFVDTLEHECCDS